MMSSVSDVLQNLLDVQSEQDVWSVWTSTVKHHPSWMREPSLVYTFQRWLLERHSHHSKWSSDFRELLNSVFQKLAKRMMQHTINWDSDRSNSVLLQNPCVDTWSVDSDTDDQLLRSFATKRHHLLSSSNIQNLTMNRQQPITQSLLNEYAELCPNIHTLTLFGTAAIEHDNQSPLSFQHFEHLTCLHSHMTVQHTHAFALSLQDNCFPTSLTSLHTTNTHGCFITSPDYQISHCALFQYPVKLIQLQECAFHNAEIGDAELLLFATGLPHLRSLDLSLNIKLTSDGLDAYLCALSQPTILEKLDVWGCLLDDRAFHSIHRLRQSLRSLNMDGTRVTSDVLMSLWKCSLLDTLYLPCRIWGSGTEFHSDVFCKFEALCRSCSLHFLSLHGENIQSPFLCLSSLSSLTKLDIQFTDQIWNSNDWITFFEFHQRIDSSFHILMINDYIGNQKGVFDTSWFQALGKTHITQLDICTFDILPIEGEHELLNNDHLLIYQQFPAKMDRPIHSHDHVQFHLLQNRIRHQLWCRLCFLLAWMRANSDNPLQDSGLDFVRSDYWGCTVNPLSQFLRFV